MKLKHITILILSCPLLFTETVWSSTPPPPTCDFSDTASIGPTCPNMKVVTHQKSCPRTSKTYSCFEPFVMPQAELSCESYNSIVQCEAWPQSDSIAYQYVFTPISGVQGYYGNGPTMIGDCTGRGGQISVTVTHSSGQTSTETIPFACLRDQ